MPKTRTLIFWFLLVSLITSTTCTKTDISCLKSIQNSLQDPKGVLSSWNWTAAKDNSDGFLCSFTGVRCWNDFDGKILNLQLSNMGLKGQFPSGIDNCKYITGLNLSNNDLEGPIPSDISTKLKYLTILDLSWNRFTGEIPSDIANCSYLSVLNLANNSFTGHIPREIGHLERIVSFSVAHNMLTGPVPVFVNSTIGPESYVGNFDLCGGPLKRCIDRGKFDFSFKSGFLISYVAFAILTIVVYASYCVPWLQTGKKNDFMTVSELVMLMMKTKKNPPDFNQFNSLSTLEFILENEISTSEKFVTRMSYKDIKKATENFTQENIVGSGETGTVYKATLPNGWSLAVKKFSNSQHSEDHFITELKILGKLRHYNINPLIGFCKESTKRLVVYNYASNGSLSDWLYTSDRNNRNALNWPLRMKIAVGIARGLAWLHHCCDFRVAHLNLSSKSVLLDQNFEPKLANFGMATLVKLNEVNGSSRGFVMDMEFWEQCFVKEDVLRFGGVLMELIAGEKCGVEDVVVDEILRGGGYEDEISECVRIAEQCLQEFPEKRPTMLDVYARISILRDRFGH